MKYEERSTKDKDGPRLRISRAVISRRQFFEKAFGKNTKEFKKILELPESFIIYRSNHINNGDRAKLDSIVNSLNTKQKKKMRRVILSNNFKNIEKSTKDKRVQKALRLYALK